MNLIYPPRCPVCHDIIAPGCVMICTACVEKLPYVGMHVCRKCGKPVYPEEEFCSDCLTIVHEYDQGMGVFLYDDVMRVAISKFKYMGRKEYGTFFGRAAWDYAREQLTLWRPEVIVPVPVHRSKKIERGYNQAAVIGRELAEYTQLPIAEDVVIRKEKTKAQKELSPEERRQNLQQAFTPGKNPFLWKRVLLVDDIYTTGSTVDAVSCVLKGMGAEEIYVLSICIGRGFMIQ